MNAVTVIPCIMLKSNTSFKYNFLIITKLFGFSVCLNQIPVLNTIFQLLHKGVWI